VVIALHGTGGNKDSERPLLTELAQAGFIAVAIDGRYHGARSATGKGSADYDDAIVRAYRGSGEHPFFYDTVWDVMRLIDYLTTRADVDPARIGLIGISKGGIETYLTAAVDSRVAVAVPCIGVQSFGWALDYDAWHSRIGTIKKAFEIAAKDAGVTTTDAAFVRRFYDQVSPGIYSRFDGPEMLPLIAPRPLLAINGEIDERTPLPGLKLCTEAAQSAYHRLDADDRFVSLIEPQTAHKVTPEAMAAARAWFVRWLKP
jgi:dienelactone hydrolase